MAKNTLSSEFRNLDVDQYNEDNYKEDDGEPQSPPIGIDEATIVSHINSGKVISSFSLIMALYPNSLLLFIGYTGFYWRFSFKKEEKEKFCYYFYT